MEKILCVDDDLNILDAYKRALRKDFEIDTAPGGEQGLLMVRTKGPYAVIVSDMRMPGMDGVQFLSYASSLAPESVRMMLTGNADQETAIQAVNEGQIFRFLNKPCSPDTLKSALNASIKQYRLIRAEKDLLEETLKGSLKVLTDVLSMVNPTAFGRAARVRRLAAQLAEAMKAENAWQIEVAAMLSQIGCITVPEEILHKAYQGHLLSPVEALTIDSYPKVGHDLVSRIPRMEIVAELIGRQRKPASESGGTGQLEVGSRILNIALEFDKLIESKKSTIDALEQMSKAGYDEATLGALREIVGSTEAMYQLKEVKIEDLLEHMIVAHDVITGNGLLLVAKGQEATRSLQMRLQNFSLRGNIGASVKVFVPIETLAYRLDDLAEAV